jgi:hypothetical protein
MRRSPNEDEAQSMPWITGTSLPLPVKLGGPSSRLVTGGRIRRRTRWLGPASVLALAVIGTCTNRPVPASAPQPPSETAASRQRGDKPPVLDDFTAATTCAECHPVQAADWALSSHAHAMQDRVFQSLVARARSDSDDTASFCLSCHSNVGTAAGGVPVAGGFDVYPPLIMEGVTCESCHRITEVARPFNAGHVLNPRAPMQGTVHAGDSSPYHDTQKSAVLSTAELCASCHDVQTPEGVVLEQPYREWSQGPAKPSGLVCVDCHMPKYYGQAAKDFGLRERPLRRHLFLGPGMLTRATESASLAAQSLAAQAAEQLRRSVALELQEIGPSCVGTEGRIGVVVSNLVAGHRLPTGSVFFRELRLDLRVRDGNGRVIHESGLGDGAASEPEPMSARLFDARGERTLLPWRAVRVESFALEPLEQRAIELTFALPGGLRGPLLAEVSLTFQTFPVRLLQELQLDPDLAVSVVLASRTARIDVNDCGVSSAAPSGRDEDPAGLARAHLLLDDRTAQVERAAPE